MAVLWTLPWIMWRWIQPSAGQPVGIVTILSFAALWVLGEWSRSWLLTGFPWLFLGYAAADTPLASWAPLLGVYGVSFAIIVLACGIWLLLQKQFLKAALLIVVTGSALLIPTMTEKLGEPLNVALVQPNTSQHLKWRPEARSTIVQNLTDLSEPHWDKDIIVWPEAALPIVLTHYDSPSTQLVDRLQQRAIESKTLLVMGMPTTNSEGDQYFNSVVALGAQRGFYHKQHLVPFGEYVPFKKQLKGLLAVFEVALPSMSTGLSNQPSLNFSHNISLAPAICYEIAYPMLVSDMAKTANLLLTVSNDTWFGRSIGPHQHMQIARMRALENAKPLLRSTNNGITAAVEFDGTIEQQLPQFQPGVLEVTIQPRRGDTIYNRFGNWPMLIVCFSLLVLANRQRTQDSHN